MDTWNEIDDVQLLQLHTEINSRIIRDVARLHKSRFQQIADELNNRSYRSDYTAASCQSRYHALVGGTAEPDDEHVRSDNNSHSREAPRARTLGPEELPTDSHQTPQAQRSDTDLFFEQRHSSANGDQFPDWVAQQQAAIKQFSDMTRADHSHEPQEGHMDQPIQIEQPTVPTPADFRSPTDFKRACLDALERQRRLRDANRTPKGFSETSGSLETSVRSLYTRRRPGAHHLPPGTQSSQRSFSETAASLVRGAQSSPQDDAPKDPRILMGRHELFSLLRERKLLGFREKDSKEVLVRRLRMFDETADPETLQRLLLARGQGTHGTRSDLVARIAEADARRSKLFKPCHMAVLNRARIAAMAAGHAETAVARQNANRDRLMRAEETRLESPRPEIGYDPSSMTSGSYGDDVGPAPVVPMVSGALPAADTGPGGGDDDGAEDGSLPDLDAERRDERQVELEPERQSVDRQSEERLFVDDDYPCQSP